MSRSLNKVMLIGNVGNDPEIRATSSGARVAKLSVATNRSWSDRSGQQQEKTEWHRLTFFGRLVDIVEQWVKKGDRLYVEGRIEYSQTEGEGGTKYWTAIVVNEMVMLGSSSAGAGGGAPDDTGRFDREHRLVRLHARRTGGSAQPPVTEVDDDLPF